MCICTLYLYLCPFLYFAFCCILLQASPPATHSTAPRSIRVEKPTTGLDKNTKELVIVIIIIIAIIIFIITIIITGLYRNTNEMVIVIIIGIILIISFISIIDIIIILTSAEIRTPRSWWENNNMMIRMRKMVMQILVTMIKIMVKNVIQVLDVFRQHHCHDQCYDDHRDHHDLLVHHDHNQYHHHA